MPAADPGAIESTSANLVRGVLRDLLLNTSVPLALYLAARQLLHADEFVALAIATTFPAAKALVDFSRRRELDPITLMVLAGIAVSAVSLLLGGSPRILLIRESFLSAAFGLACLVSLAAARPLMFYLGRYFIAGADPARRERYARSWQFTEVRHAQRLITAAWGVVMLAELALRTWMAFHLPPAVVLVAAPIVMGALVVGLMIWTFGVAARMQRRVLARWAADAASPNRPEGGGAVAHPNPLESAL